MALKTVMALTVGMVMALSFACGKREIRGTTIERIMEEESRKLVQPDETGRCPEGMKMSGGMALSGAVYPGGCRTEAEKLKADIWFQEMWCGEMGMAMGSGGFSYSRLSIWENGGCRQEEVFRIDGKRVTKKEFEGRYQVKCEAGWKQDGMGCTQIVRVEE